MSIGETYLRIVLTRWRLVLALLVSCTLAAWAVSMFYLASRPTFEAAARLNIVPTAEELGYASRFVRGSTFDGGSVLLGTYAEYARTRPVVEPIVDRWIAQQSKAAGMSQRAWVAANSVPSPFSPSRILAILNYGEAPTKPLREDVIETLLEGTTIENVEGTYLVRLAVAWEEPKSAAWFANELARAIIVRAETASRSRGQGLSGTLVTRLEQKRTQLAQTLDTSRSLKARIGVVDIDQQKQSLLEARLLEQALLTTDQANLDSSQSQVAALRTQAGGKLSSAQQILEQTLATEAPRAAGLARSVATRQARIGQISGQLGTLSGFENRVKLLDDQARALQAEVTALTERVSFSETENLANTPRIQLIEWAIPPLTRSSPKIFFNTILGFIAGCALAACALLLLGPGKPRPARVEAEEPIDEPAAPPPFEPEPPMPTAEIHPFRPAPPIAAAAPRASFAMHDFAIDRTIATGASGAAALARPAIEEPVFADLFFAETLPRPANGELYSAQESAALARRLMPFLADLMALDRQPLFIAAAGDDGDAQLLYRIVYDHFRRAGFKLRTIDATLPDVDWDKGDGKPLVYLGGIAGSARPDALARIPADGDLAVAIDEGRAHWRAANVRIDAPAHVVAFAR